MGLRIKPEIAQENQICRLSFDKFRFGFAYIKAKHKLQFLTIREVIVPMGLMPLLFRDAPLILFIHQFFPANLDDVIRAGVPGDVPWRAWTILNQPQVKFALEVGIIKVNQDKFPFAFVPASKELDHAFLHALGKMIPPSLLCLCTFAIWTRLA